MQERTSETCADAVRSVMSHCSVVSCVGSQAVPTSHVAPVLGLDRDSAQLDDDDVDDQQVNVPCNVLLMYTGICKMWQSKVAQIITSFWLGWLS